MRNQYLWFFYLLFPELYGLLLDPFFDGLFLPQIMEDGLLSISEYILELLFPWGGLLILLLVELLVKTSSLLIFFLSKISSS